MFIEFERVLMMAYLTLFEYLALHTLSASLESDICWRSNERLYMNIIWACFMQMINLGHVAAHLQNSKFINIRTRLRTNVCVVNYNFS